MSSSPNPAEPPAPPPIPEQPAPSADLDTSVALLAELDSLLERMMALPVSQADEANDAGAVPQRRTEVPPEDLPIITVTETTTAAAPVPAISATSDDPYFQAVLAEHDPKPKPPPEPTAPPEPVVFQREPAAPEAALPELAPLPALAPEREPMVEPGPLGRSIRWCNRAFDQTASRLGPPGRWLTARPGRALLGWSGVLMLAAVAGLAVFDALRWTW